MISRSMWTTRPKVGHELKGPLGLIVIHHSYRPDLPATADKSQEIRALQSMDEFHRESQGWAGLGYSFCVFQSGNVYEGRGWLRTGAHTEGQNSKAHGICLVMDGSLHEPSAQALEAIRRLIREGINIGAVKPDYDVQPHDKYKRKVCPGNLVKKHLPELRPGAVGAVRPRILKEGDRGEDVKALQRALKMPQQTGFFGPLTREAVEEFQRDWNKSKPKEMEPLVVDGVVGPATRAAIGV